jgi:glycerol-3-phosphate dehydrogenase (NAD(P)+)
MSKRRSDGVKVAVIGAGSWGTAIAGMLGERHNTVILWAREEALAGEMKKTRQNVKYLPDVKLPASVAITSDLSVAAKNADIVVVVTPSHGVRQIAARLNGMVSPEAIVVSAAKGLEIGSLKRMSEVIAEEIPYLKERIAALSGPNHAEEVGQKQPTASVVACSSRQCAEVVQDVFMAPYFRVYTNPDIIGVELGGALKNIIALGAGIAEGLLFGDNAKAALMTRGLAEISRLGIAMGAKPSTFAGLAGVGDLIVTCTSQHSRNRRAGMMLAEGKSVKAVETATKMVVEGIRSTLAAYELAKRYDVDMPIAGQIYRVLYEGINPKDGVTELMSRVRTHEVEEVAVIDNW